MTQSQIIKKVAAKVKVYFNREGSGHDWYHIELVWKNAKKIAQSEPRVNMLIVELAALLHELGDHKLEADGQERHAQRTQKLLESIPVNQEIIDQVIHVVSKMSFSKNVTQRQRLSVEGKIVQDADRLEALGAIGIARAFAFGGARGRMLYDPANRPQKFKNNHSYKKSASASINHFYEKLLSLKKLMNTKMAKQIAQHRHEFMKKYLEEFFLEWQGKR